MIDRTHVKNIDWALIALLLVNSILGVVFIYSSSHYLPTDYHLKQIFWIAVGLGMLFVSLLVDYRTLVLYSGYFYAVFVILLGGMLVFGIMIAGTKSWIRLPLFQIQPSELMKIVLILILARLFSNFSRNFVSWDRGLVASVLTGIPLVLVALQPDLGTAASYLLILLGALILGGLNRKLLIILLIAFILVGVLGWNFLLRDYQKERLNTLLFPDRDPLGSGYHVLQSKIAVGSGGFLGKGFKSGTQSQLKFLPARHTDFIFSVIGEEFGFIGIVGVMLFYFLFLARLFQSVAQARDRTGVYIIFMFGILVSCQFFLNVLMTVGLFPVAGIPLPLLSYGGSSLLTHFIGVGLVLNVKMRRFVYI